MDSVTFPFAVGLIVWAAAYVLGLRNKVTKPSGMRRIPLWAKLVMMAVVLSFGAVGLLRGVTPFAVWVMLGVISGSIGDLILAGVFPLEKPQIPGMLVFAVGHAFYIAAPLTLAPWPPLVTSAVVALGVVLGVLAWRLAVYNPTGRHHLNVGSLFYGLVIMVTLCMAVGAALRFRGGQALVFALGVALFTASDMLLAQYMIRESGPPKLRDAVWGLYSTGQLLIVTSTLY